MQRAQARPAEEIDIPRTIDEPVIFDPPLVASLGLPWSAQLTSRESCYMRGLMAVGKAAKAEATRTERPGARKRKS